MPSYSLLTALFEIGVLWFLFYQIYRVFKNSRGAAIMIGLTALVIGGSVLLEIFQAQVLKYIVSMFIGIGTILVVLFQQEIRTGLAKIGTKHFLSLFGNKEQHDDLIESIVESVSWLAHRRYGALLALERKINLDAYMASAVRLDAEFSRELIGTIFLPKTLLHDGAVLIQNERILGAAAILPVTNRELRDSSMGLRHRAGIGLAEETDAVVIIVSEETGAVSIAVGNTLERNVDITYLSTRLRELFNQQNYVE